MTDEQKKARRKSAENGHIKWIKDNCLRTKDGSDDYVFISYRSDDFEQVLDDILYNTCRKYGLRVYFDTAFDENSDSWITQYYDNMCDTKCKAFVAFLDDKYYSSYACLLEMMSSRTAAAGGDYRTDSLFFLPVNIGSITADVSDGGANTGLGTKRFSNGKINSHAGEELERFNEIFSEVADDIEAMRKKFYKREKDTQLYEEATLQSPQYGKIYLNVTQCRRLMDVVIPKKNDNDGSNKGFVDAIHDKLVNAGITSVFGKAEASDSQPQPQKQPSDSADWGRDSISIFYKKYKTLSERRREEWKKNNKGITPAVEMTLRIELQNCGLEESAVSGSNLTALFRDLMNLLYKNSGEEYFAPAAEKEIGGGNAYPLIITGEHFSSKISDKSRYSKIENSDYYFYNFYSAKDMFKGMERQMDKYLDFLRKKGMQVTLDDVLVQYRFGDDEVRKLFAMIEA